MQKYNRDELYQEVSRWSLVKVAREHGFSAVADGKACPRFAIVDELLSSEDCRSGSSDAWRQPHGKDDYWRSLGEFLFQGLYDAFFANQAGCRRADDGVKLLNCYITTIVRWAPPLNKPTPLEVRRCLPFLERELKLLENVKPVLGLGKFAYDGHLRLARKHPGLPPQNAIPFGHGAVYDLPHPLPRLYCSYHPSQHNTQTGRLTPAMFRSVLDQIRDWLDKSRSIQNMTNTG